MRTDLFAFKINYNDIADVNKRLYNGNISQTNWNSASINNTSNPESNQYLFEYDTLYRITKEKHVQKDLKQLQEVIYTYNPFN